MTPTIVIAVDGPVAAGKSTLARLLARRLGLRHLDSGLLYRATAARLLAMDADIGDEAAAVETARALRDEDLERDDLRSEAVGGAASAIAAMAAVREALLEPQRRFAATPPGAVVDGRDIGTRVCPEADAKLFVTAEATERARRRHAELLAAGESPPLEAVLDDLEARDRRDSRRAFAPLRRAADAFPLDTTGRGVDESLDAALAFVRTRLPPAS